MTTAFGRVSTRPLLLFSILSLAAIAAGGAGMAHAGLPPSLWLRNVAAWAAGGLLALLLARAGQRRATSTAILVLAMLALVATLLMPGQEGVNRWIDIGPLHINVAALLLPAAIVALARTGLWSPIGLGCATAVACVLLIQPDASQATAFATAIIILLSRTVAPVARRLLWGSGITFAAAATWARPDPLQPVAEVEEIFALCLTASPLLALAAGLALAATSLLPFVGILKRERATRDAALALVGYFVLIALLPAVGVFPVPLVGLGMSFVVGYWLGFGMLYANSPQSDPTQDKVAR